MDERAPEWPAAAIWPAHGLTEQEAAIVPRAWTFTAGDGYPLAVLSWPAPLHEPKARVVLLHGVQSHAGWYHGLGRRLAAAGYEAIFPDRRGSGANRLDRGHAPSAQRLIDDLVELIRGLCPARADLPVPRVPTVLAGISWGGKLAIVAAARHPDLVDELMLICPGLHPRMGISRRDKLSVAIALLTGQTAKRTFLIPLADPALFTGNSEAQTFLANDPLSLRAGTAGLMFASRVIDSWVARCAQRITQPTLLHLAELDRIVDNERTQSYFERIGSRRKQSLVLKNTHHTPEFEPDPSSYARAIIKWLGATVRA